MRATLTKDARRHLPILRVLGDGTNMPAVALDRAVCVIGRGRWANLPLDQAQVSKVHALIIRENGHVYLRDLASTNGVKRNGESVHEADLTDEDVIRIGGYTLGCESGFGNGQPAVSAPAAQLRSGEAIFALPEGRHTFLLGRRKACDVRLDHESVGPVHGVIFEIDGKRYIQDFGSTGGTTLNGRKIHRDELNIGDEVSIGDVRLTYEAAQVESAAPAAAADEVALEEVALEEAPLEEVALEETPLEEVALEEAPLEEIAPAEAPQGQAELVEMETAPEELPEDVMLDPVEGFTRNPNASLDEIMASELPMADEEALLEPTEGVDRDASTVEEISDTDRPHEDVAVSPGDALDAIELEPMARSSRDDATLEEIDIADLQSPEPEPAPAVDEREEVLLEPAAGVDRDNATLEEIPVDELPTPQPAAEAAAPAGVELLDDLVSWDDREDQITVADAPPDQPSEIAEAGYALEEPAASWNDGAAAEAPVEQEPLAPLAVESPVEEIATEPLAVEPMAEGPTPEPVAVEPVAEEPTPEPIAPKPIAPKSIAPKPIAPKPIAVEPVARKSTAKPIAVEPIAAKPKREGAPRKAEPPPAPPRREPEPVAEEINFGESAMPEEINLAEMESVDWDAEVPPETDAPQVVEPAEDSSILEFITTLVDEVNEKSSTLKTKWNEYQQGGKKNSE